MGPDPSGDIGLESAPGPGKCPAFPAHERTGIFFPSPVIPS